MSDAPGLAGSPGQSRMRQRSLRHENERHLRKFQDEADVQAQLAAWLVESIPGPPRAPRA